MQLQLMLKAGIWLSAYIAAKHNKAGQQARGIQTCSCPGPTCNLPSHVSTTQMSDT